MRLFEVLSRSVHMVVEIFTIAIILDKNASLEVLK